MPPSPHAVPAHAAHTAPGAGPLAVQLEHRRLVHRAARIRHTLTAMRRLASSHREGVPAPLRLGITDFGRELQRVERRLRDLER
jgi:hypothetical protein